MTSRKLLMGGHWGSSTDLPSSCLHFEVMLTCFRDKVIDLSSTVSFSPRSHNPARLTCGIDLSGRGRALPERPIPQAIVFLPCSGYLRYDLN